MPNLIVRGIDAQPGVEIRGQSPDGSAARLIVLAGQIDVIADAPGGPARTAGTLRFLVPGAPSLPSSLDAAALHASVTVHPLGVLPISASDVAVLVVGARAAFVPDDRGGITLGVELALETLYLAQHAARLSYQVVATVPDA